MLFSRSPSLATKGHSYVMRLARVHAIHLNPCNLQTLLSGCLSLSCQYEELPHELLQENAFLICFVSTSEQQRIRGGSN
uniref:Ovule protein n=1 Tax=Steinernema glaseri TaxID=37863 RepID=A0A1I7YJG1_9BILA